MGHIWKQICTLLRIERQLSTAFHPKTDGAIERANQEIEQYLYCFIAYFQDNWDLLLPIAIIAINNCTATLTGMSPFFAIYSYHINPIDINKDIPL